LSNPKNKAIVILIPGFAASESDSTCLPFVQNFLRNFDKTSGTIQLFIIAFQYPYSRENYTWEQIPVYPLNGRNRGKFSRLATWRRGWKKFAELSNDYKIIGILSFWLGECSLVGKFLHKKYDIPFYTWLMGQDAKSKNFYQPFIKPKPEMLVALSDALSEEYSKNYRVHPKYIIPLGTDPSQFKVQNNERDIGILAAGSLIPLKRYDQLLIVIASLKKAGHQLKVMIAGEGPLKKQLSTEAIRLGLDDVVHFTGELAHSDLLNLMSRSKLFIHTSSYEGNSAVCAEAVSAGAHVISFCQPMKKISAHYHIVNGLNEMISKAHDLLHRKDLDHSSIIEYPISKTCERIMNLFS